ncbi:glutaredoxin family protein [Actinotalea sp.]|uniref:glutaredoxin family protein n=1 Tax=Actinotalea sp. TaxID=1872145 RepID=UPI003566A1CA
MSGQDGRLTLYVREGCHLCDDALGLLTRLAAETGVSCHVVDIDTDPVLVERFGEMVPVVTVDGVVQGYWRIDAGRVRRALAPR